MKIDRSVDGKITIWVRADEENTKTFVYRAAYTDGSPPPACYSPTPSLDKRGAWTVISTTPLSIPECDAQEGPNADGTLYTLQKAG